MDLLDLFLPPSKYAAGDGMRTVAWHSSRAKTQAGVVVDEELALTYGACWVATRIISEGVSNRDRITYQRDVTTDNGRDGPSENRQEAIGHPVYELLRHFPNPLMGAVAFWGGRSMHQVNFGNGFAEIERDPSRRPVALWPIHPGRVKPKQPGDRYKDGSPIPDGAYLVRNNDNSTVAILKENMLHVPGAHSEDGVWGKGVISYHRETLGIGIAGERHFGTSYGAGNIPRMVLLDEGMKDAEQRHEWRQGWKELHGSPDSGEIAILWHKGSELKPLSFNNRDSELLESRKFTETQIATIYRIPAYMVNNLLGSKYASIEAQGMEFVIYSLFPWCRLIEEQCNLKLFDPDERKRMFVQHDFNGLLRGDMIARMNAYRVAIMIGVLTINECRRLENMNGIGPIGDKTMFPCNMATLENVVQGKVVNANANANAGKPGSDHSGAPANFDPSKLPDDEAAFDGFTRSLASSDRDELLGHLKRIEASLAADRRAAALPAPRANRNKARAAAKRQERQAAARAVLVDALARLFTKEANAAKRAAAGKGDFDKWAQDFYAEHQDLAVATLAPPCTLLNALGAKCRADVLAKTLADESQRLLAAGYRNWTPEEFVARVSEWPTARAARVADGIFQ
jgi:HK97 family phage portal protein